MNLVEILVRLATKRQVSIAIVMLLILSLSQDSLNPIETFRDLLLGFFLAWLIGDPAEKRISSAEDGEADELSKIEVRLSHSQMMVDCPSLQERRRVLENCSKLFKETFSAPQRFRSVTYIRGDELSGYSSRGPAVHLVLRARWYSLRPERLFQLDKIPVMFSVEIKRDSRLWYASLALLVAFLAIFRLYIDYSLEFWQCAIIAVLAALVLPFFLRHLSRAATARFPEDKLQQLLAKIEEAVKPTCPTQ